MCVCVCVLIIFPFDACDADMSPERIYRPHVAVCVPALVDPSRQSWASERKPAGTNCWLPPWEETTTTTTAAAASLHQKAFNIVCSTSYLPRGSRFDAELPREVFVAAPVVTQKQQDHDGHEEDGGGGRDADDDDEDGRVGRQGLLALRFLCKERR